jgi:hypothetical protein
MGVDRTDVARSVDVTEGFVDGKPEVLIAVGQRQRIWFHGKIVVADQ